MLRFRRDAVHPAFRDEWDRAHRPPPVLASLSERKGEACAERSRGASVQQRSSSKPVGIELPEGIS